MAFSSSNCNPIYEPIVDSGNHHSLIAHSTSGNDAVQSLRVTATRAGRLEVRYLLDGDISSLKIPALSNPQRHDNLWRHTCGEMFIGIAGCDRYCEFNFSPSSEWAAYEFDGYRQGMRPFACEQPEIKVAQNDNQWMLVANVVLPKWLEPPKLHLGLSMVIENNSGHCSYWALHHAADQPDFHRRESWRIVL